MIFRDPDAFARDILHRAVAHGDLIGHDAEGNAVVALAIPQPEFDALATFDADGDADLEPQCEDEGAQCEGEGEQDEREPETDKGAEDEGEPELARIYGGGSDEPIRDRRRTT